MLYAVGLDSGLAFLVCHRVKSVYIGIDSNIIGQSTVQFKVKSVIIIY